MLVLEYQYELTAHICEVESWSSVVNVENALRQMDLLAIVDYTKRKDIQKTIKNV